MAKLPIIVITPGDPAGIGPEVVEKALLKRRTYHNRFRPLIIGAPQPFQNSRLKLEAFHSFESIEWKNDVIPFIAPDFSLLRSPRHGGWYSGWAIETATKLCLNDDVSALVTGPIDKDRLQKGGFRYFGHTDFIADLCRVPEVTMMLANSQLRVSLVTIHQSLASVSKSLTKKTLDRALLQTKNELQIHFGIKKPRIAVLGLNPHSGENGLLGHEEQKTIIPTIEAFRKRHLGTDVLGPFPADTFFAIHYGKRPTKSFDAVVAMYHDQGLIPVKMLDFDRSVNLTLGLPIIRTSVDHGTAFDIVGNGTARSSSMEAALDLAYTMALKRIRKQRADLKIQRKRKS